MINKHEEIEFSSKLLLIILKFILHLQKKIPKVTGQGYI